jgi:hypothetical protein
MAATTAITVGADQSGESDGTRTRGLLRDRQAFYPAELRPRMGQIFNLHLLLCVPVPDGSRSCLPGPGDSIWPWRDRPEVKAPGLTVTGNALCGPTP